MEHPTRVFVLGAVALLTWGLTPTGRSFAQTVPTEWQALDAAGLTDLANQLTGQRDAGTDSCRLLAGYVTARQATAAAAPGFNWADWLTLGAKLGPFFTPETRATWAAQLKATYAAPASMGLDAVTAVGDALLGLKSTYAQEVLVAYTERSQEWRSLTAQRTAQLAAQLDRLGDGGVGARRAVAQHVMAAYLGGKEAVKAIDLPTWIPLARMGRDLPSESRQTWAGALRQAFAPDAQAVLALTGSDVTRLTEALKPLDWEGAVGMSYAWVTGHPLTDISHDDLYDLGARAVCNQKVSEAELATIPAMLEATFAIKDLVPRNYDPCIRMMCQWHAVGNWEKNREWTLKAYQCALGSEAARATVTMKVLDELGEWLHETKLVERGRTYPAFAAVLVQRARVETLETTRPHKVGGALGAPEARQALREQLLDAQGNPRLDVAKILAGAYAFHGGLEEWRQFVEAKMAEAKDSADLRARWLVIRACTEAVLSNPPSPLRGKKWLDEAVATASSETVRVQAFRELMRGYAFIGKHDKALALADTMGQGFSGAEGIETAAGLRTEVQDEQKAVTLGGQQAKSRADALYAQELKQRLESARAKGDKEAVDRYERLLGGKN